MHKTVLALVVALLASPVFADTLVENANGIQVDGNGRLQHFTGLLIGDDGKVMRVLRAGEATPHATTVIDAHGRSLLPGLIDSHGHVMDLGMAALTVQLIRTTSITDLQQRLPTHAAAHPCHGWITRFGRNQE